MIDATGMLKDIRCLVITCGKMVVLITYRRGVYGCSFRQEGNPKASAVRRATGNDTHAFLYLLALS